MKGLNPKYVPYHILLKRGNLKFNTFILPFGIRQSQVFKGSVVPLTYFSHDMELAFAFYCWCCSTYLFIGWFFFLKYVLFVIVVQFPNFPLWPPPPSSPFPLAIPPLSSCPWVVHVSSLASPLPILLLTSPWLFCTYQLCF